MDPRDDRDLTRLVRAANWSRREQAPFRRQRTAINRLLAGSRYGEGNLPLSYPIPYLKLLNSVLVRSLVSSQPRCMLTTKVPMLKPVARAAELAMNSRIRQADLASALRWAAADALSGMGIIKVGVCYYPIEGAGGLLHDYQETYCDPISLDDWLHDHTARRFDHIGYCGHRCRIARKALQHDPRVDQDALKDLPHADRRVYDEYGHLRSDALSTLRDVTNEGEHEDMIEYWEFWLPRDRLVITLPAHQGTIISTKPLTVTEYIGPELGPYHLLRFGELPDNIFPSPPLLDMADIHEAMNGVYRKLIKQALRQKTILAVMNANDADAERIAQTPDGRGVRVDHPEDLREVSWGGVNQIGQLFFKDLQSAGNYFAGNLEALAGLGAQSDTLGQDQLLTSTASKQIQAMQEVMQGFTRGVLRTMAWHWWVAGETYQEDVPVDGMPGLSVPSTITPEMREGHWLDLNFEIDAYSLQNDSPAAKLQTIQAVATQLLIPGAQMFAAQGAVPNLQGILRLIARYTNMTDLDEMVMFAEPQQEQEEMNSPPKMPSVTHRTNTRISRPGGSIQGQRNAETMALMGAANEQQQGVMQRGAA